MERIIIHSDGKIRIPDSGIQIELQELELWVFGNEKKSQKLMGNFLPKAVKEIDDFNTKLYDRKCDDTIEIVGGRVTSIHGKGDMVEIEMGEKKIQFSGYPPFTLRFSDTISAYIDCGEDIEMKRYPMGTKYLGLTLGPAFDAYDRGETSVHTKRPLKETETAFKLIVYGDDAKKAIFE